MNTVIEEMLKSYQVDNIYDRKNAMKEIMQEIVLCEYSGRFYTACPVMETVDSGMMETAIPEMQNQ